MSKFAAMEMPVEKPARMIIIHPVTREPLRDVDGNDGYVDIHSMDSDTARRHAREAARRRLNTRGRIKITPEEIEAETVETLASLCCGWHLVSLSGAPLDVPFSRENARDLISAPGMAWLREQVEDFASDRANFLPASSSN